MTLQCNVVSHWLGAYTWSLHTTEDLRSYSSGARTRYVPLFAKNGTLIACSGIKNVLFVNASRVKKMSYSIHKRNIKHLYHLGIHISHALPDAVVIATPNKNRNAQNQAAKERFVSKYYISTVGCSHRFQIYCHNAQTIVLSHHSSSHYIFHFFTILIFPNKIMLNTKKQNERIKWLNATKQAVLTPHGFAAIVRSGKFCWILRVSTG